VPKGIAWKLTVDSDEPLEDAMRVLGALYGVTLVISNEAQEGTGAAQPPAAKREKAPGRGKARTRRSARRGAPGQGQQTPPRAGRAASNADVRAWARQNGLTVSDRGRVPASVLNAYRDAHEK